MHARYSYIFGHYSQRHRYIYCCHRYKPYLYHHLELAHEVLHLLWFDLLLQHFDGHFLLTVQSAEHLRARHFNKTPTAAQQ